MHSIFDDDKYVKKCVDAVSKLPFTLVSCLVSELQVARITELESIRLMGSEDIGDLDLNLILSEILCSRFSCHSSDPDVDPF